MKNVSNCSLLNASLLIVRRHNLVRSNTANIVPNHSLNPNTRGKHKNMLAHLNRLLDLQEYPKESLIPVRLATDPFNWLSSTKQRVKVMKSFLKFISRALSHFDWSRLNLASTRIVRAKHPFTNGPTPVP